MSDINQSQLYQMANNHYAQMMNQRPAQAQQQSIVYQGNPHIQQVPNKDNIIKPNEVKKENTMYKAFKEYVQAHKEIIFTIFLVFLADKFLLGGALKARIKGISGTLLDKAEAKISKLE